MKKIDGPDFSGIVAVSPTPFTQQNIVDTGSIRRSVRLALDGGVTGFLVPAMAGEALLLTDEERRIVVETTVDEVNGRALVIGGASADSQSARRRNAEALAETGCDAILAHFACDDEVVCERNIHEVAEVVPGCLVVQDAGGNGLPVPLFSGRRGNSILQTSAHPAGSVHNRDVPGGTDPSRFVRRKEIGRGYSRGDRPLLLPLNYLLSPPEVFSSDVVETVIGQPHGSIVLIEAVLVDPDGHHLSDDDVVVPRLFHPVKPALQIGG